MWNPQITGRAEPLDYATDARQGVVVRFFNAVYAWMATGLAVTGVVGWLVYTHPDAMRSVMTRGASLGIFIAELVLVVVISSALRAINATAATLLFLVFAALNGLMLSVIFFVYTLPSIAATFAACAAMFAAMSFYGMVTKSDLSTLGKILFMALIGLIVASVVNIFFASSALYWIISYAGVIIFAGLTAYDTQRLRQLALSIGTDGTLAARMSVVGALMLYLDFINMFLFLLRFMGNRKN
jgi:FtsH-binding integral membrane protein